MNINKSYYDLQILGFRQIKFNNYESFENHTPKYDTNPC